MCAPVRRKILVVEDEVLIRLMISDVLMRAGFQVIQAASADEALKVLQSSIELDLVMTDVRMPGSMNGLELASRVRTSWPALKIVILSGEYAPTFSGVPADAVIGKPFQPADVIGRVKQLLGLKNDRS